MAKHVCMGAGKRAGCSEGVSLGSDHPPEAQDASTEVTSEPSTEEQRGLSRLRKSGKGCLVGGNSKASEAGRLVGRTESERRLR